MTKVTPVHFSERFSRADYQMLAIGVAGGCLLLLSLPLANVILARTLGTVMLLVIALALGMRFSAYDLPLKGAFVTWLVAALLSLFSLEHPSQAFRLIWSEVLKSTLIFYAAFLVARWRGSTLLWSRGAGLALAVLALVSIVGWWRHGTWQAVGLVPALGDYTTSALTLLPLVALPLFLPWRGATRKVENCLLLLVVGLGLVGGALTMSRGFWLIVGLIFGVSLLGLNWKVRMRWWMMLLLVVGSSTLLALAAFAVARWRGLELLRFTERSTIYWPVIQHILEAPLTGFGYGHEAQHEWYLNHMPADWGVFHAHNIILSYIEQMGGLGLIALLSLFGGLAFRFVRHLRNVDEMHTVVATLGLGLVVGIFVRNNLDIFFVRHNILLFFLVCGLMLGMLEGAKDR